MFLRWWHGVAFDAVSQHWLHQHKTYAVSDGVGSVGFISSCRYSSKPLHSQCTAHSTLQHHGSGTLLFATPPCCSLVQGLSAYPFGQVRCELELGSWSYGPWYVNVTMQGKVSTAAARAKAAASGFLVSAVCLLARICTCSWSGWLEQATASSLQ